jgi:hypothetical protein
LEEIYGWHNVLVLQSRLPLTFTEESVFQFRITGETGQEKLNGGDAPKVNMARFPHFGHSTLSQFLLQDVLADFELLVHVVCAP